MKIPRAVINMCKILPEATKDGGAGGCVMNGSNADFAHKRKKKMVGRDVRRTLSPGLRTGIPLRILDMGPTFTLMPHSTSRMRSVAMKSRALFAFSGQDTCAFESQGTPLSGSSNPDLRDCGILCRISARATSIDTPGRIERFPWPPLRSSPEGVGSRSRRMGRKTTSDEPGWSIFFRPRSPPGKIDSG